MSNEGGHENVGERTMRTKQRGRVGVPWRKNEDNPEKDDDKLRREIVMMDKDWLKDLVREQQIPVP